MKLLLILLLAVIFHVISDTSALTSGGLQMWGKRQYKVSETLSCFSDSFPAFFGLTFHQLALPEFLVLSGKLLS